MVSNTLMKGASLSALVTAIVMAPGVLHAQDTTDLELPEVIVTAQGREQNLQDVPVAVSVVSGESLERLNIKTLDDLSTRVGNVKITSGTLVNSINIRGVGSGENPGFEQTVATFSDGVYRSRSRATQAALFDVERVEILKGPQTTFFGANASAGALNITTRKPKGTYEHNFSALYGFSDEEYNIEGGVSFPVSDTLGARVAGRAFGIGGWVDLAGHGDAPDSHGWQGRASLRWTPNDVFQSDFRIDYVHNRTDNIAPFQLMYCPPPAGFPMSSVCQQILDGSPGPVDDRLDFKSDALPSINRFGFVEAALTNVLDVGPGSVRSTTAYSELRNFARVVLVPHGFPTTVQGYDPFPSENTERYRFFSQELRFESDTDGAFDYMIGGYFSKGKLSFTSLSGFFFLPLGGIIESVFGDYPDLDATTPASGRVNSQIEDRMWSVFVAATIRPADRLQINLGARYVDVDKDGHRTLVPGTTVNGRSDTHVPFTQPGTGSQPPLAEAFCLVLGCSIADYPINTRDEDKFLPSAGLQFDVTQDVMLYATYSKGFKAGGFSATSSPSIFGPEEVDAYEVGMKGRFFDRRLTLNLATFLMDYTGLQETTFDANLASTITNVAAARSQGVEVSLNWRASSLLNVYGDVAYLDATYRNYPNGECTKFDIVNTPPGQTCVQNLSGRPRANAPEWSGAVGFDVAFPVGGNQLTISPSVSFSSPYFMTATADPLLRQESYAKLDLRAGFGPEGGRWQVALIGRNLTDEAITFYRLGVPGANGSVSALVDRGRSIGLQFSITN